MSTINDEYFFIRKSDDDRLPLLEPDSNTEDRRFRFERQPMGSPPLVFNNAWKDHNRKNGISGITPDILFAGADLVVRTSIRERLLMYAIPSLHMHPTVYIDNQGKWHEDFWYLIFTDRFDCWSRAASEYDEEGPPIRLGGFELHQVFSYSLDEGIFDKEMPDNQLLFKMGGDLDGFIVCHSRMAAIFRGTGSSGATLMKISDY